MDRCSHLSLFFLSSNSCVHFSTNPNLQSSWFNMHLPHSLLGFAVSHSCLQFSLAAFATLCQHGSLWKRAPLITRRQDRKRRVVFISADCSSLILTMLSEVYIPSNQILCKLYYQCPDSMNFCFYRTDFLSKDQTSQFTAQQDKLVINVLSLYF